jgi:hypothetical protein
MTTPDPPLLTPLGQLLEHARQKVMHISGREAARLAGMSEGRWRQIVRGVQAKAGMDIPVTAPARTIVAMALAVEVDPAEALRAAGFDVAEEDIQAMADRRRRPKLVRGAVVESGLADEIDRIRRLRGISPNDKIRMVQALIELHEERDAADHG